jgi:hypothetical protein
VLFIGILPHEQIASAMRNISGNLRQTAEFIFESPEAGDMLDDIELPPTFIFDETVEDYVYIPLAERIAQEEALLQTGQAELSGMTTIPEEYMPTPMTPGELEQYEKYITILVENENSSELSENDLEYIEEYAQVSYSDLIVLENKGLTLSESLPYAQLSQKYGFSVVDILKSYPTQDGLQSFSIQMGIYDTRLSERLRGSGTDTMFRGYLLAGYPFQQLLTAYGVSLVLETEMGELLAEVAADSNIHQLEDGLRQAPEPSETRQSLNGQRSALLTEADVLNYIMLADDLGIRADALLEYAVDNSLSFQEIEKLTNLAAMYLYESFVFELDIEIEDNQSTTSSSPGGNEIYVPELNHGAPFSYDRNSSERVKLNTGGLVHESVDYVLPGINGLDLVIGRRYDSDAANIGTATGQAMHYVSYSFKYVLYRYEFTHRHVSNGIQSVSNRLIHKNEFPTLQQAQLFSNMLNLSTVEILGVCYPIAGGLCVTYTRTIVEEINGINIYTIKSSDTTPNNYFNEMYGLGHGWSFMFSSIQDGRTLHLADGSSYEIMNHAAMGQLNLKEHTLEDLRLERVNGGYNNGTVSSAYTDLQRRTAGILLKRREVDRHKGPLGQHDNVCAQHTKRIPTHRHH